MRTVFAAALVIAALSGLGRLGPERFDGERRRVDQSRECFGSDEVKPVSGVIRVRIG